MAIYHFSGTVIGRKKTPGASCCAGAAYRSGEQIGEHDYTKKQGVAWSGMLFCEGCPEELRSREALWSAVDRIEKRSDAQLYRSFDFAFPNSFSYDDCREVMCSFAQEQWVDEGMCADLCIHDKETDGQRNLHGHAMLTMRDIDENGIGKKNRAWNEHELMEKWREAWEHAVNARLRELGSVERIDHRSYEDQGETELIPTQHMGAHRTALERKGISTLLGDFNRRVKALNDRVRNSFDWKMKRFQKLADEQKRERMDVDAKARSRGRTRTR